MDCPRCENKLKDIMQLKKHIRVPLQRRYKGGVRTTVKGDTRPQTPEGLGQIPPDGMTVTDECMSCHWRSVRKYNAGNRQWIQIELG